MLGNKEAARVAGRCGHRRQQDRRLASLALSDGGLTTNPARRHGMLPPPFHTHHVHPLPQFLQAAADGLERQSQQAQRFVQQDRGLTPAVCAVMAGPVPSVAQCLEGLADIW